MDYLHRMGRFILLSLFVHLLFAYVTTFVNPARKVIPLPPIRVSLLETEFEDNEGLPSGTIIEIESAAESDVIKEPREAKYLAESASTGGMKKRESAGKPDRTSFSAKNREPNAVSVGVADVVDVVDVRTSRKIKLKEKPRRIAVADADAMARENPAGFYDSGGEAVVPLNTKKFEYAPYFLSIKREIEENWYYPASAVMDGLGGNTLVRFTLLPTGEVESVAVVSSSGEEILDDASIGALKSAQPFNPFPAELKKRRIHVVSNFSYQPSFSPVRTGR